MRGELQPGGSRELERFGAIGSPEENRVTAYAGQQSLLCFRNREDQKFGSRLPRSPSCSCDMTH